SVETKQICAGPIRSRTHPPAFMPSARSNPRLASIRRTPPGLRRGEVLPLCAAIALGACCGLLPARALEPTTPLSSFSRQSWVMENGLPQNTVQALAQTNDGFLWLGTEVGLVRFDGSSFAVFDKTSKPALPGNDVQCLLAAWDGSLWVGTSDGLA